ncbi:MAG: xanthine dehydrogenase family protein subunit M [Hyphomicrobiales bacterium]|nr:xanthine dehydrogenase family protein subunit M [Hyphomicrobiales bacterium]
MRPFAYYRPTNSDALEAILAESPRNAPPTAAKAQFIAGGTTILDLMKLDVVRPEILIDINQLGDLAAIESNSDGLRLGALARMDDVSHHPAVMREYPVIAQSLDLAASLQIRNMASVGGNVLQRTRCTYFRDASWKACNKRSPGSGCAAMDGFNRAHAVLGTSPQCIATYPGDFAQALIALDAQVEIRRGRKRRDVAFADLHRPPGERSDVETSLAADEMIAGFLVPPLAWSRRSRFVKVRDRESYEFALASAAVALDMAPGGMVNEARIALGGVATIPWRAREAEFFLAKRRLSPEVAEQAAELAFRHAEPRQHNAFKITLGRKTLERALLETASIEF